jgi:glucose-1-phosphate adenylyltransferase
MNPYLGLPLETRAEAHLKRVIVDRFNDIPAKIRIGFNADADAKRYFVDASGIVVVPRGETVPR